MTVTVANPARTVLLLLPAVREIFAMSTAALTIAQSSPDKLARDYRDALVLDLDGSVRKIDRINIVAPAGESPLSRFVNRYLTGTKAIDVTLSEPLDVDLDELKAVIVSCVRQGFFVDPDADELECDRIVTAIKSASEPGDIVHVFKLPEPEHALDGL